MNVYFVGTEDVDFATLVGGSWGVGGVYRTGWVRNNYNTPAASSYLITNAFGSRSSVWAHAWCNVQDNRTTAGQYMLFLFETSSAANGGIGVIGNATAGQVSIVKRSNAGTVTTLATSAAGAVVGGQQSIDFNVNYSTSGRATLWMGPVGSPVMIADTGPGVDVTTDGATGVSQFYMAAAGNNNYYWSEVIVADSDTRGAGVWLMNSNTAGNAQTWTGTATNVNKTLINDATFISAVSPGLIEEYQTGGIALPSGGPYAVAGIKLVARAQGGEGGPQHLEYVTRVAGTDYVGGSYAPALGSFANDTQNYFVPINPATGVAWTTGDLTATSFNYGVESVA